MFRFLLGVAFGAAGYWAWQSFGRDLLGLGNDQDTYGGYSSGTSNFNTGSTSSFGTSGTSTSAPSTTPSSSISSTETPTSGTT
jgi:hypothetical protein